MPDKNWDYAIYNVPLETKALLRVAPVSPQITLISPLF